MIRPTTDFVEIAGRKTQITSGGEGPPLLYLHSAGGETEWTPFFDDLAQSHRVIVPAHPGFALSGGLETIRDVTDIAWHYIDLFAHFGWERLPIVGFSLGAWIAAQIAILRPALVSRLVLTAAAGVRVEGTPMGELFTDDFAKLRKLLFFDQTLAAQSNAVPKTFDDPKILLWLRASEATARVAWNPYLHDPKLPKHLHRISQPTLVLWGRHDRLLPLACGEEYHRLIPNSRLEVLEECGHMVPYEKPAEFLHAVRRFLGE